MANFRPPRKASLSSRPRRTKIGDMRILILILILAATPLHAFPVKRCINLGNALDAPNEGDWGWRIEEHHLARIAEAGFDTVRLPARVSAHWDDGIDPAFLARMDEVIGWARESGLRVILDLHHFEELMQDPDAHSETFLTIWQDLSAHYGDAPDDLIFELLNEPSEKLSTAKAVTLFTRAMPIIREDNPDRWVIIGGGKSSDEAELAALPAFDDRTVHTFHFYDPYSFTHQQAEWVDNPPPPRGWGDEDRDETWEQLERGLTHSGAPVFLGEFGVYDRAPIKDAFSWLAFVREAAESAGVGWCAWSFAQTFAFYDLETDDWIDARLHALIPPE